RKLSSCCSSALVRGTVQRIPAGPGRAPRGRAPGPAGFRRLRDISAGFVPHRQRKLGKPVRTYSPKPEDIDRQWLVIDASDVVLGRLATHAAQLLRGKHKPTFTPNTDTGDYVIVVNAEKVVLTRNKLLQKKAYRHSGYPGGLKEKTYAEFMEKAPHKVDLLG